MKLLIIVLCILSERYLIHRVAQKRFDWFDGYVSKMQKSFGSVSFLHNSCLQLLLLLIPVVFIVWLLFYLIGGIVFGFGALLLNFFIFYYCIGTENVFYPVTDTTAATDENTQSGHYLARVNSNLFAPIFWFVLTGALGVLIYRLLTLCMKQVAVSSCAEKIVGLLDWITVRVTLMLYLLVGNFQRGFDYYQQTFLSRPDNNQQLLSNGGLLAARTEESEVVTLPNAQRLVEHALIVFLVLIALFTLVSWL